MRLKKFITLVIFLVTAAGCASKTGNVGQVQYYATPKVEAKWIREGQPITFENVLWYPVDDVEVLKDTEVIPIGEFQGVQVFVEKTDVRPYDRLYTKFEINKYRFYESRHN